MSLEDAVELVIYAFNNSSQGDIFIQKSPACSLIDLVNALKKIFSFDKPNKIIGTRHGEKLYESLLSKEEMARAIEEGKFYRLPPDNRDLNYDKYFIKGKEEISNFKDYTSHNTKQLNIDEIIDLLTNLQFIKDALNA
tara:strand:- start:190 stop:603 length:414 start_codon:yes stop_codon:yes gene_type:complete